MIEIAIAARLFIELRITAPHGPLGEAVAALADVVARSDVLTLPDRFNTAFCGIGWVTCGSMPTATMEAAIAAQQAGRKDEFEDCVASI